jgi:hypothetical protein
MKPNQNEELRRACLDVLASRHPTALEPRAIRRRIVQERLVDFEFDDPALDSALEFLAGQKRLECAVSEYGSTKYWRATAEGMLAFERVN